jgi:phosphinothricin acetyltransferase
VLIREATPSDAPGCAAVYAPYVHDTAISFETEPPDAEQMATRMASAARRHAWLVGVDEATDTVLGYAYAATWKSRAAYRWTCEVSVYLAPGRHGSGHGRALYEALFARLVERGYRTAVAGIALPNPASEGLHRALGFEPVGVFRGVGWKHGAWHDVAWLQRRLVPDDAPLLPEPH